MLISLTTVLVANVPNNSLSKTASVRALKRAIFCVWHIIMVKIKTMASPIIFNIDGRTLLRARVSVVPSVSYQPYRYQLIVDFKLFCKSHPLSSLLPNLNSI